MVTHVVLMKPRPDLSTGDRQVFVAAFEHALREIPTIRHVRIGRRITHGAGYEQAAPDTADFLAAIDFDDVAGLQAYLRHPAHDELGARFAQSLRTHLDTAAKAAGVDTEGSPSRLPGSGTRPQRARRPLTRQAGGPPSNDKPAASLPARWEPRPPRQFPVRRQL